MISLLLNNIRDDTWLKLFPDSFVRSDPTVSFFTTDTVEVDNNVTRHLSQELDPEYKHKFSQDWDVLVLHYLGLDHVGHTMVGRKQCIT